MSNDRNIVFLANMTLFSLNDIKFRGSGCLTWVRKSDTFSTPTPIPMPYPLDTDTWGK